MESPGGDIFGCDVRICYLYAVSTSIGQISGAVYREFNESVESVFHVPRTDGIRDP